MTSECFTTALILTIMVFTTDANGTKLNFSNNNLWNNFGELGPLLYEKCTLNSKLTFLSSDFKNCCENKSLSLINSIFERDVIVLADGFALIKQKNGSDSDSGTKRNILWTDIKSKLKTLFETHLLRMDLEPNFMQAKGRRRRQNQMMALMMFGVVATGMMLIPMGFHFLAILGGKALLLAKMALLLSSIQGLKKIATSNLNYGLYQTNPPWRSDQVWRDDKEAGGTNVITTYQQPPNMFKPEFDLQTPQQMGLF